MVIKLIAWGHGDPTVGDGTFNAKFELDVCESDADWAKDHARRMLSTLWDLDEKRIHVVTEEEFEKLQEAEEG